MTYPDAGHQIVSPYTPTNINYLTIPGGFVELLGGTPVANARASEDSWPKINDFLAKALPLE
ncbi:MAG TPA: acyl-CoA thioester hydrolase/BAAT C-terminal domain-containing protein [Candidatus Anoxymicrobiaceae bacterium]